MNMFAMKEGLQKVAGTGYNVMSVFEKRLKPNTVITTPNSDVIYGLTFADLSATGPLVLEVPPRLQALMDDFWHRPLTGPVIDGRRYLGDVGIPGPDRGKGGRYLIVPDGYEGDTEGYFAFTCPTHGVFIFVRGFFSSVENLKPGVASVESLMIRPLEGGVEPMRFEHVSDLPANALFPADGVYFEMLDRFIRSEPSDAVDPYMHGMLAALGIAKGQTFAPTDRQRELLDLAAHTGWRMAKNIAGNFDGQDKALWWSDRRWVAHVKTEPDDFMHTLLDEQWRDRTTGHTDVDAKAHMFINHYSISTGMMSSIVGMGAKYGNAYKDSDGAYLKGENTYRLDMPPNPPANLFWSVTLYDAETAGGVDAEGQEYPSLNSMNDLDCNSDGSVTFHIGPNPPVGAKNWLKTVPGRGWFSLFRFYGPDQEFFDGKYRPGDFVKVDPRS
ncbi:hypothetical protein ACTIVE_8830 [Actinomadura verrucosospora]|uniref:DUF1254 domain-containing protein n=2 Tax=Actinomadura verrucosospora TaxID=46165 RepID=A0A7D3ZLH3_ACTVE|nr:hypothetical protein ACTIVE_8830 [Actinomadura verrucosospora]